MIFGPCSLDDAEGAVLAHRLNIGQATLKKGHVLSLSDISLLRSCGYSSLIVARPEAGDVDENKAAFAVAKVVQGAELDLRQPFTGRCNLYAKAAGLFIYDNNQLDSLNLINESVTLAALPNFAPVSSGQPIHLSSCPYLRYSMGLIVDSTNDASKPSMTSRTKESCSMAAIACSCRSRRSRPTVAAGVSASVCASSKRNTTGRPRWSRNACCSLSGAGFICRCPCAGARRRMHSPSPNSRNSQCWASSRAWRWAPATSTIMAASAWPRRRPRCEHHTATG